MVQNFYGDSNLQVFFLSFLQMNLMYISNAIDVYVFLHTMFPKMTGFGGTICCAQITSWFRIYTNFLCVRYKQQNCQQT